MKDLERVELWLWRFRAIQDHSEACKRALELSKEIEKLFNKEEQSQ